MATYDATGTTSVTRSLTATTVDTINFGGGNPNTVEVINLSGNDHLWFTLDGTDPTVEGDGTICVPGVVGASVTLGVPSDTLTVKVIATSIVQYHIRRD